MTINTPLIQQSLRALFPDPQVQIGDGHVDAAVHAMRVDWRPEWEHLYGVEKPNTPLPTKVLQTPKGARFYMARATHERFAPISSSFTGHLPMVRIPVPATGRAEVDTGGGTVFAGDTLLYNLEVLNEHLAEFNANFNTKLRADSAEFIIPPRLWGARFGAIGIILIRREGKVTSYGLLPGMATGEVRLVFIAPVINQAILRRAWYQPTPFSKGTHWYRGDLQMDADGDQVRRMEIGVLEKKDGPEHLRVTVDFDEQVEPNTSYPGLLTVQAACRVCLLAQKMGQSVPGIPDLLRNMLAAIATTFPWNQEPT